MAKPKLALIPAAQGSKFYSVLPSDGVGDFDFARASAATRINKYGLIETVASGQSRLNYPLIDGVVKGCPSHILEPARTNLIPYSESFDNAAWGKQSISVIANAAISPNGTLTADKIIPSAVSTTHQIYDLSLISSQVCAASVFAKSDGVSTFEILDGSSAVNGVFFDLSNSTFTNKGSGIGSIEYYGNGWYRCTSIATTTGFRIYCPNSAGTAIGDGVSGLYLWGAQFEAGSYPTSYIPTNGSTVTRVAETAANAGDASTFNDSEGVFMAELLWTATSSNIYISIDDNTSNNRVLIYSTSTDDIKALVGSGGSTQAAFTATNQDPTTFSKVAVKYKQNDFALWINGFEVATDTSGNTPIGLNTSGFRAGGGTTPFHGSTKQIQYYETALNSEELETLTSWVSFQDMAEGQLYTIE